MPKSNPASLVVKVALLYVSTLTVTAGATISPALPAMKEHFRAAPNADFLVALALSITPLFIVLGSPAAGAIVDRWGRKALLLLSVAGYGVFGVAGFWINSLEWILVSRALLGLAVAGLTTCITTLIADYYSGPERAQMMGFQAGFMSLDGVIFTLLGGFLANSGWRNPFLLHLLGLLALPMIAVWIFEPARADKRAAAPRAASRRAASAAAGERLPIGALSVIYFVTLAAQVVFYLTPVNLPFFLQDMVNARPSTSGMAIAVTTLFMFIGALSYKRIVARTDFWGIVVAAMTLMGLGYTLIGLAQSIPQVIVGLVIGGFGLGLLLPNNKVWVSTVTPIGLRGRGLGLLMASMYLGQFLSPIVTQPIKGTWGIPATFVAAGILMFVLAAVFMVVKSRKAVLAEIVRT